MRLSGKLIVRLMRKHKKSIREIAKEYSITMKRVREVRANGVEGFLAKEWIYLITGKWPDQGTPA